MLKDIIVTTSFKVDSAKIAEAQALALQLGLAYVERRKNSLPSLIGENTGAIVVYKDKWLYQDKHGQVLCFHPDTAMLRIKAPHDPLREMVGEGTKTVLDCTMGLATDSIVLAASGHTVTAIESQELVHLIISHGLQTYETTNQKLHTAMRSIRTVCDESYRFLQEQAEKSVDIVYVDPMFSEKIEESSNLDGLVFIANPNRLTRKMLEQAKRVAREKVIVKAHFRDSVFEEFGFVRQIRPNQKFHYGEILLLVD